MAVLVEAISVIVRRDAINRSYDGGWAGFLSHVPNNTLCADHELARVGFSGDRDTFQLASEKTTILYPVKAGEMARIGPKEVRERYGVASKQVPDFIALRGDPSDRLPVAPGTAQTPTWHKAAALARKWQLNQLAGRLEGMARNHSTTDPFLTHSHSAAATLAASRKAK